MPLHLVKLCVGCDTPGELAEWQAARRAQGRPAIVHTRNTPRRAAELLAGGSLYRVFKGVILTRQPILAIDTIEAGDEAEGAVRRHCEIRLSETLILTAPGPKRPFQGWRYLEPEDAPDDLPIGAADEGMPGDLARELRALGVW